jgi:hypothetical protein
MSKKSFGMHLLHTPTITKLIEAKQAQSSHRFYFPVKKQNVSESFSNVYIASIILGKYACMAKQGKLLINFSL